MNFSNKIRGLKEIWNFDNRWYLVLTRLLFPKETVNIYKYNDVEILIDHTAGDANGARDVFASDMYRQYFPLMKLPEAVNVIDLGANNGGFPLLIKSLGIKIKRNVSVELNPNTFSRLRFNMERNFADEIIALNAGVCGTERAITINLGTGSVADNIYENKGEDESRDFTIQGVTFDEIFDEYFTREKVDICKIDVEGAEFEIFADGHCERLRNCKYLIMEIHHQNNRRRDSILNKLKELGFTEINGEDKDGDEYYVHFFVNESFDVN